MDTWHGTLTFFKNRKCIGKSKGSHGGLQAQRGMGWSAAALAELKSLAAAGLQGKILAKQVKTNVKPP